MGNLFSTCSRDLVFMATSISRRRRRFLQIVTGSMLSFGAAGVTSAQENESSVILEDQTTEGDQITVKEIVTAEPVVWKIHGKKEDYARGEFDGGKRFENKTFELETEINESRTIWFSVFSPQGGNSIAYDGAFVTIDKPGRSESLFGITEVGKNPEAGFHFPYFLYLPTTSEHWNPDKPLLVHQNNSPKTSDDYSYHKKNARSNLEPGRISRQLSDELGVPALVPATPRPHEKNQAQRLQSMDQRALRLDEKEFERIDLQIINMIEDAQEKLANNSHPVRDKVILNGYSGSGQFAQRFSILHPEKVLSVTAGGFSGAPTLPLTEAKGHTLNYYLGIADLEDLIDKTADLEAFAQIDKLYYEGGKDTNDFLLPDDPHRPEIRDIALDIFGEDITEDRVPFARQVFQEANIPLDYRIYEDQQHEWAPIEDLIEHHRPHVPENTNSTATTPDTTTTKTTKDPDPTSTVVQDSKSSTETNTKSQTISTQEKESGGQATSTDAAGFQLFSGLASLLSASYVVSRLSKTTDE